MHLSPLATSIALTLLSAATSCAAGSENPSPAAARGGGAPAPVTEGWLRWRGPLQTGVSLETGLPDSIEAADASWTFNMRGRGAPVMTGGKVFCMAYEGELQDLDEALVCLDERTGKRLWEHRFNDFMSDIVYDRYAISSPSIDPETGHVFCLTTPGLLCCFTQEGELIWQQPLVEKFGRMTYPNGRTLGPLVDDDLVILHTMTSTWGPLGPARDRALAFDKQTGDNVFTANPCGPPKDSPYSYPVFEWRDGQRLMYFGTAGGNVVCVNARTGESVWRYQMSIGGICASPVIYKDTLIAIHGKENLDTSGHGRLVAIKLGTPAGEDGITVLDSSCEAWRNDELQSFTSSLVLAGNRIYNTGYTGELFCVDADSGELLWHEKLAPDQIHASPLYADGKLYVPMNNGSFYVIKPGDEGAEILSKTQLEGNCLGAPTVWNGRIYLHTTEKLYCFGDGEGTWSGKAPVEQAPAKGPAVALQVIPAEVLLTPGQKVEFRVRGIDSHGQPVSEVDAVTWKANPLGVSVSANGRAVDTEGAAPGAAVMVAQAGDLRGSVRFRITYPHTFKEDFEAIGLTTPDKADPNVKWGRPPGFWISGFPKWDVREVDGSKVLAKTINNPIFQRTMGFFGDPSMSEYTMQMDIMTDGNRRTLSSAGMTNQRYLISLKGNYRELEISSNVERIKHAVPFQIRPNVWYTLKSRVDLAEDGSATVRAKAWPRDEKEPAGWLAEVIHRRGHAEGAPGIWGFSPQSRFRVYVDNIAVSPNAEVEESASGSQ